MNPTLARTLCRVLGHRWSRYTNNRALLQRCRTCKRCATVEWGTLPTPIQRKQQFTGQLPDKPF